MGFKKSTGRVLNSVANVVESLGTGVEGGAELLCGTTNLLNTYLETEQVSADLSLLKAEIKGIKKLTKIKADSGITDKELAEGIASFQALRAMRKR